VKVTSGASTDIISATKLAREMVTKYGMSKTIGVVAHNYEDDGKSMSTETRLMIESEVRILLQKAYENARNILILHQKELHALATHLLEYETLTGLQIKTLLSQVNEKTSWSARPSVTTPHVAAAAAATAAKAAAAIGKKPAPHPAST
jgi:ATP-dependent metalloprotease